MNVTLSIPDELVEKARALAKQRGTSLNQMIREQLERETGGDLTPGQVAAKELREMWATSEYRSDGQKLTREEIYAERLK